MPKHVIHAQQSCLRMKYVMTFKFEYVKNNKIDTLNVEPRNSWCATELFENELRDQAQIWIFEKQQSNLSNHVS